MCHLKIFCVIAIIIFCIGQLNARPSDLLSRQRRTSDHRIAELETMIALSNMGGYYKKILIGLGVVDPAKLGRKKRELRRTRSEIDLLADKIIPENDLGNWSQTLEKNIVDSEGISSVMVDQ